MKTFCENEILSNSLEKLLAACLMFFLIMMNFPAIPVNSIPLVLLLVVCFKDWHEVRKIFCEQKVVFALILAALTFGLLFSLKPERSFKGIYDFLRGGCAFFSAVYMLRNFPGKVRSAFVWGCLICSLVYSACVGYAEMFGPENYKALKSFLAVLLGHHNTYGTAVALIVYIAISALLLFDWRNHERGILLLSATLSFLLLVYSGSRGSLLSLFVGVSVILGVKYRKYFCRFFIFLSLGLGGLWVIVSTGVMGNFLQSWVRRRDTLEGRVKLYVGSLSDVWNHSKFFGFGPNTYKYLDYGQEFKSSQYAPHSVYVECFFSLGLVGSFFLFVAFVVALRKAFLLKAFFEYRVVGFGLIGFLLVRGMLDMKLFSVHYSGALAIAFAFVLFNYEGKCRLIRT